MRAWTESGFPSRNSSTGTVASTSTSATERRKASKSPTDLPLNLRIVSPGWIAAFSAGEPATTLSTNTPGPLVSARWIPR